MDETTWHSKLNGLKSLYEQCKMRPIYEVRANTFSEEFRNLIESFPDTCQNQFLLNTEFIYDIFIYFSLPMVFSNKTAYS